MQYTQSKDPDEVLDYTVDWSNELTVGETINTHAWVVGTGLTKDSDQNTATTSTVWVSGGTGGEDYECVNTIVTTAGRTHEKTIIIPVQDA